MEKTKLIYQGKAKKVFQTNDPDLVIQEFTDNATAFNAKKKGIIKDKGVCNNKISAKLFELVEKSGIPTHFVKLLSDRDMLVMKLKILPIEVTMRNIVAGGMAKMLGLEEGMKLKEPVLEYHYKNDALDDPLINDYHILAIDLATKEQLDKVREYSFKINDILSEFFKQRNLILVDFKLEFGVHKGEVLLGDEISPDTMRLWEIGTGEKMDKDRFRRDLGKVEETYQEVLKRVLS